MKDIPSALRLIARRLDLQLSKSRVRKTRANNQGLWQITSNYNNGVFDGVNWELPLHKVAQRLQWTAEECGERELAGRAAIIVNLLLARH